MLCIYGAPTEAVVLSRDLSCFYHVTLCYHGICCHNMSVHLFVTNRSATKMAESRIMQTMPYNSPGTLVCQCQRSGQNSKGVTPSSGPK